MRILISSVVDLKRSAHNRLHEFVRHLSRNHQVTILSIKDWWKSQQTDVSLYDQGMEDIWQRVDVRYFTDRRISPIMQELFSVLTVGGLLQKVGDSFDVHFNYNTLVSGLFVAAKMRAAGVGTIYDLADDLPAMIRMSPQIPPALRPLGGAFAKLMVHCNLMISEKVTLTTDAIDLPCSFQKKCTVIPNGVDTTLFRRRDSGALREQLGIDDGFVLGYVGVLREWVDLEPALGALVDLHKTGHNVKLLVVGEEGGLQRPKALVNKYGVSDLVVFTGTVPYPKVPWYMSCMDAALIPFKRSPITASALPLKLLEYMACEIPVLSTCLPGIESAAGDRVLYVATPDEIVRAVNTLQQGIPRRWIAEGRHFVEENYSLERIVFGLENTLNIVSQTPIQG
jgi:glycosyltransferase involved in cell wall biosynthesis